MATTFVAVQKPLLAFVATALLLLLAFARRVDGWRWLLALTITLLVCASSNLESLVQASFYPRYAAVGALIVWGLCLPHRQVARLDPWTRVFVGALWAMGGLATASVAWSIVPAETMQRGLALLMLAALTHVLLRKRWGDRTTMMADLRVIYVVLSLSAVISLGRGLTDGTLAASVGSSERFQGLYNNPNMLSIVCALTIPLGWAVYRHSRNRVELLGIAPAVACVTLSQSRTGFVAVLVGALWVLLRHGLGPLARLAAGTSVALLVAYLFDLLPGIVGAAWTQRFVTRFTAPVNGDLSNGRTEMWQTTVDLWWQNRPTLGYGYASRNHLFELASYDEYFGVGAAGVSVVHNSYLQLLLELGLTAVVPLVLLLLVAGRVLLRAPLRRANSGLVWLVGTGLLIQLTESAMFGTGQTYPYVFWFAVGAVLLHLPRDRQVAVSGRAEGTAQPVEGARPSDRARSAAADGARPADVASRRPGTRTDAGADRPRAEECHTTR
ncbi:O-antigen ligase family protein [Micromonospora palythoicola]|uniref:O-antigen ligase family protein n=1 Tax=Micromonospora palythoicola TaxID=3120507 RepID=UPI002FCE421A